MIPAIGINAFQPSAHVAAGQVAPARNLAPEKSVEDLKAAPAGPPGRDPVPVRLTNLGGASAIAAQIEASRASEAQSPANATGLSDAEQARLRELEARDREVKAHETAHQAVGGRYTGAASFTFARGPNGRLYAVGGEVAIDLSAVPGDPDATIAKLRQVRRAALAPLEPSAQDRNIAARAEAGIRQAQADKRVAAAEERAAAGVSESPQSAEPLPGLTFAPATPRPSPEQA